MTGDKVRMPAIKDVAAALKARKHWCREADDGWLDVRLQVTDGGEWAVRTGDSSYDLDHRGYWGCGSLSPRTNCRELAADLIGQCADDAAQAQ
jgi:hypothetical protein